MKQFSKRILSILLTILIGVGSISGFALAAHSEEIEITDAYVLTYDGTVEGYAYGHLPYMYKSPFKMNHSYNDPEAGANSVWTYTYTNEIFQLVNTRKLTEGGDGPYASIPVYCTDADTGTRSATTYRRINLEDSSYYASGAAQRLRSVILNSFPYIQDISAIQVAANAWLTANGKIPLQNLQTGETMLATQQAIWEITHGEKYTVNDHYTGTGRYDGSDAVYQINADEVETEYTESNIISLYEYFLSLDGISARNDAASEYSFENTSYIVKRQDNGTYSLSAEFDVNTSVGEADALTLTATCDDKVESLALNSAGRYSFTFEEMDERLPIKLEINGYQSGDDVYLFDALGDRGQSQSMIGYDNSRLPIHGEILLVPERIIEIYKTTSDEGKIPLANITFDIYSVATIEQLENGDVILGETPTTEDIANYVNGKNPIATITTDVQGYATYNFTKNGYPDGVYLVAERFSAATTGPVDPFFVIIPGTATEGTGYHYTVTVNPKNTTEAGPDIKKDVTEINNDNDSYDVNDPHTWIIRGGVPAGIASAEEYTIHDVLDYRLSYVSGSPIVKLYTKSDEEMQIEKDAHYVLTENKTETENGNVDFFNISLTKDGMTYIGNHLGSGDETPEIRVYFKAVIDEDASMGEEIPNQAHLDYVNSAGIDYDADSDKPIIYMGGINILKLNTEDEKLEGATFRIAREATEAELQNDSITKEKLTYADKKYTVIFEDFYTSADFSGEKVYEVTTDKEGKAAIYGLSYGSYFLVETKAPETYNLLSAPVRVTINKYSHLTEADNVIDDEGNVINNTIRVINTKFALPETGGMGTSMFTVTGLAIIASALTLMAYNTKNKKA